MVEETKDGWYSPVVTSGTYTINAATASISHTFTFTNTPFGDISAKKKNGFDDSTMSGWDMTLQDQDPVTKDWANVSEDVEGAALAATKDSTATWNKLPFGTYRVVEETKDGWYSPVVTSGTYTINAATASISQTFTFTNTPFGAISAEKMNGFDDSTMSGWDMTLQDQDPAPRTGPT